MGSIAGLTDEEATIQAQIDLSLSVAEDLVASWMKPSRKSTKIQRDTEKELEEYMKRPPRYVPPAVYMT